MNLSSYLHKRPGSQNWQLRWMVPKHARKAVGRSEFTKSLGVTDRKEAERLAFGILSNWQEQVDRVVGNAAPSSKADLREASRDELARYVADRSYSYQRSVSARLARALTRDGSSSLVGQKTEIEKLLALAREQLFLRTYDRELKFARAELAERGLLLPSDFETVDWFAETIAQAAVDRFAGVLAEMDGRGADYAPSKAIQAAVEASPKPKSVEEEVLNLFERYAAQRASEGVLRRDTIEQARKVVTDFADFVGNHKLVREVRPSDVRRWRDALVALPRNFRKLSEFRGLSLKAAAEKAGASSASYAHLSALTINKYLSTISPFFAWCWNEGYADRNPCDGLFYAARKGKNARPPFSASQLNRIISSPLFTGFERDGREEVPGSMKADDWRYWIPLVCMFTGARIGEIAQLHLDDIAEQDGIPFIHIKHDESQGKTTKAGVSRVAPIHPILASLGFLDFVLQQRRRQGASSNSPLFPQLERNERGNVGAQPSRFWRKYLSAIGIKTGADGIGAHSFRHTLADQLRIADYLDNEIEVALGHNRRTVTSGYGRIQQGTLRRLYQMFQAIKFEGVHFEVIVKA